MNQTPLSPILGVRKRRCKADKKVGNLTGSWRCMLWLAMTWRAGRHL